MTKTNPSAKTASRLGMLVLLMCSQNLLFGQTPEHWPQFRGPDARGIAGEANLPDRWSTSENIAWKTALPGPGASSPAVLDGKIFLTCYSGVDRWVNTSHNSRALLKPLKPPIITQRPFKPLSF